MLWGKIPDGERVGIQMKVEISARLMILVTQIKALFLLSVIILCFHVFVSFSIFFLSSCVLYFTHAVCRWVSTNTHSYTKAKMKIFQYCCPQQIIFCVIAKTVTRSYEDKYVIHTGWLWHSKKTRGTDVQHDRVTNDIPSNKSLLHHMILHWSKAYVLYLSKQTSVSRIHVL